MVQHMPHLGSAISGGTLISRQSGLPSTSTIENAEEEASAVQAVTKSTAESAEPATAEQAEDVARAKVTH